MASMQTVRPFTFFDAVLITLLVAGSLFCYPFLHDNRPGVVAVVRDNATIATYPSPPIAG